MLKIFSQVVLTFFIITFLPFFVKESLAMDEEVELRRSIGRCSNCQGKGYTEGVQYPFGPLHRYNCSQCASLREQLSSVSRRRDAQQENLELQNQLLRAQIAALQKKQ